jgi:hypothetical protein
VKHKIENCLQHMCEAIVDIASVVRRYSRDEPIAMAQEVARHV